MRASRFPLPALALGIMLLWPIWLSVGSRAADAAAVSGSAPEKGHAATAPAKVDPRQSKTLLVPQSGGSTAVEKNPPPSALRLEPITEVEMRSVPASLPWAAVYAHTRATAWLAAVRKAANKLPQRREISMGAVSPAERLALAAQLYTATASPPGPEKADPLHTIVTLEPRPQPEQQILSALRNAELLELRRRLIEETRATLQRMNRHWPGGSSDAPSGTPGPSVTLPAWTHADWARAGRQLDGLWLAQAALALTPGGWLASPDALPALENAARLAPSSPVVRLLLAEAQLQSGLPQQCVESCDETLRQDPALGRARYIRGLAHWRLQQLALAEDDLSSALAAGPKPSSQGIERARLLRARGAVRLLRRNYDGMCEDFATACALGDCEGLAVARAQNYCRAGETIEDAASRQRSPAVLPPAFQINPRDLPLPPAQEPAL